VVRTPYDGHPVGSVPAGGVDDAAAAIDGAEVAARVQRETPAHERFAVLLRAADLADGRAEDIAQTVSAESGKPITEARGEAGRLGAIIRLAAYEGGHLYGSTLPLDANPEPVWTISVSRCGSREGSSWRSARSTFPR
jgi:glyceraldehyde-3-phosphate dehydrogenase (NADP+)